MSGSLPEVLARAARERPDHPAVVADRSATYAELDDLASRVAAALADAGVGPGDRVAVSAPKSVGVVAAIYGIMRAGAAYVPIDPASPVTRAAHIANDCAVAALIADPERSGRLFPALREGVAALDVERLDALPPSGQPPGVPGEDDLAYVLYTSGSTGGPKGVMLSHRNALSFVKWAAGDLGLTGEDRLSSHAPFHFDLSVFDLYACASAGGTLHPLDERAAGFGASMAAFVAERQLTVVTVEMEQARDAAVAEKEAAVVALEATAAEKQEAIARAEKAEKELAELKAKAAEPAPAEEAVKG